jgi:hypothetical protein
MADLAQVAIELGCNLNPFEQAMAKASSDLARFGQSVTGTLSGAARSFEQFNQAMAANPIGAAVMMAMKLKEVFDGVRAKIGEVADEVRKMIGEGQRAAAAQERMSRLFGISGNASAGLILQGQKLGLDPGAMQSSMQAFSLRLSEAAQHGGDVGHALNRIGLDARQLQDMGLNESMARVADSLKGIQDPAERSHLMIQILGRRGMELEPIFNKAGAEMARAAQQAERWGLTFSDANVAAVKSASNAQKEANAAMSGIRQSLANSLAVAAAPVQQFIAGVKTSFAEFLQDGAITQIREWISDIGRLGSVAVDSIKATLKDMQPTLERIGELWNESWTILKQAVGSTDDMGNSVATVASVLTGTFVTALEAGVKMINIGSQLFGAMIVFAKAWAETTAGQIKWVASFFFEFIEGVLDAAALIPGKIGQEMKQASQDFHRFRRDFNDALTFGTGVHRGAAESAAGGYRGSSVVPVVNYDTPAVRDAAKVFENLHKTIEDTNRAMATLGQGEVASRIYELSAQMQRYNEVLERTRREQLELVERNADLLHLWREQAMGLRTFLFEQGLGYQTRMQFSQMFQDLTRDASLTAGQLEDVNQQIQRWVLSFRNAGQAVDMTQITQWTQQMVLMGYIQSSILQNTQSLLQRNAVLQDANRLLQGQITPLQNLRLEVSRLDNLLERGAIGEVDRAMGILAAYERVAQQQQTVNLSQAMQAGSQESIRLLNQQTVTNNQDNSVEGILRQMLAQDQQRTQLAIRIANAVERAREVGTANLGGRRTRTPG